jgi:YVTN family beta-propeller protein
VTAFDVGHPSPAWFSANATDLWVASNADNVVLHLDPKTGAVLATVAVGNIPQDGTIAADGSVWVPNLGDGTVSRIDPTRNVVTNTIAVGAKPFVLNSAFGSVWVPSYGGRDVRRISG